MLVRLIFLSIFICVSPAFAGAPVVFFSDATDGATTGWDGSETKGAAITVWGLDFGSAVHTSYVTVGGQTLYADESGVAEWGATTSPTTARGLQRITFYLNSSMTTGGDAPNTTIVVTTSEGSSSAISFHCRAIGSNHIYFFDDTGNDSTGDGSLANPWKTGEKAKGTLVAGDAAYFRTGTYTHVDTTGYSAASAHAAWIQIWGRSPTMGINSGTAYNSILVSSYPGEVAQVGNGEVDLGSPATTANYGIERLGSLGSEWNYWTFSKMNWLCSFDVASENTSSAGNGDIGLRWVGNIFRTTAPKYAVSGTAFPKEGGGVGMSDFYMLGNMFEKVGVPLPPAAAPTIEEGLLSGLTGVYKARYSYAQVGGEDPLQESEMSPVPESGVSLTDGSLKITWASPPVGRQSGDWAFTHVKIYRTKTGGSTYYFEANVAIGDGSYDSNTADESLDTRTAIEGGHYSPAIYIGGYGQIDGVYIAYNEMSSGNGAFLQNYGHVGTDRLDNLYAYSNYIHDAATCGWNARPIFILGGGDPNGTSYAAPYVVTNYVYNNLLVNNGGQAFRVVSQYDGGYGGGGTFYIYNNTTYDPRTGFLTSNEMGGSDKTTLYFRNNINYSTVTGGYNTAFYGEPQNSTTGMTGDHNLWYGNGAGPDWSTTGDLDNTDPLMTDPANEDFTLTAESPCIGAGASLSAVLTDDYLGGARGASFDMGAYEYGASGDSTPPTVNISTEAQTVQCDSVSLAWTDGDNVAVTGRKWRIGSAPNGSNGTAATSPATVTGMSIGANTIYIGAGDAAGNWGSDSVAITYTGICQPEVSVGRYGATGAHGVYSITGAIIQ